MFALYLQIVVSAHSKDTRQDIYTVVYCLAIMKDFLSPHCLMLVGILKLTNVTFSLITLLCPEKQVLFNSLPLYISYYNFDTCCKNTIRCFH